MSPLSNKQLEEKVDEIHKALLGDLEDHEANPGLLARMAENDKDHKIARRLFKFIGTALSVLFYKLMTGDWIPFNG